MKIKAYSSISLLIIVLILVACGNNVENPPNPPTTTSPTATKSLNIPAFNADSAFNYVAEQVAMGPRVPKSEAHKKAAVWMAEELKTSGAAVIVQDFVAKRFDGESLPSKNIIASFNPNNNNRVLLCAHWDSRFVADHDSDQSRYNEPILAADDGGSGVGVLLEIARLIGQDSSFNLGVDIVLFDAEDQGAPSGSGGSYDSWCLGSQYWAKNPHKGGYKAKYGILLDMVGSKSPRFTKEGTSMKYAPNVMNKVWEIATNLGYGAFFDQTLTSEITDDHLYMNTIIGIPTIDIINRDLSTASRFGTHWHTHNDNMDIIGKGTLKAVGTVVMNVLYKENAGQLAL